MNRHNAKMNAFAVQMLDVAASDRIVEIGFGGGVTLLTLIADAAFVAGVDRSPDAVAWAKSKYSQAVAAGRADFRTGNVEALPFADASFGKACTVNTIYFWGSLQAGFAEIRRVLMPGGYLAVGFLPKDRMERLNMPPDIFTLRTPADVIAALKKSGFGDIRVERPQPDTPWNVVVARC